MSECLPIIIPLPDKCYCDYDRDEILEALGMQELITEQTLIDGTTEPMAVLVEKYREYSLDFAHMHEFNNGSGDPVNELIAKITFVQEGSGDPSPSNIRPIFGFKEVNVSRTGLNAFKNEGWTDLNSQARSPISQAPWDENGQITFYNIDDSYSCYPYSYEPGNVFIGRMSGAVRTHSSPVKTAFTLGSGTKNYQYSRKTRMVYYNLNGDTAADVESASRIMILPGPYDADVQGTFEPYKGTDYTVNWEDEAGTVYGGEINLTTGVMTVTHRYYSFDGTETWYSVGSGSATFFYRNVGSGANAPSQQNPPRACSHFPNEDGDLSLATSFGFSVFRQSATNTRLRFKPDLTAIPDVDTWKQFPNGTPVQCVYELREDLQRTYQLTPTEITTLLGFNRIWADTGDVSLIYT